MEAGTLPKNSKLSLGGVLHNGHCGLKRVLFLSYWALSTTFVEYFFGFRRPSYELMLEIMKNNDDRSSTYNIIANPPTNADRLQHRHLCQFCPRDSCPNSKLYKVTYARGLLQIIDYSYCFSHSIKKSIKVTLKRSAIFSYMKVETS